MAEREKGKMATRPLDQRIQQGTNTRYISVGKLIPADWQMARITREEIGENEICLRLVKLNVPEPVPSKSTKSKKSSRK